MASIRRDGRLLTSDRVISLINRWMPERAIRTKFLALVVTQDKGNLDSLVGHITSVKTKPGIHLLPAIGELRGIASCLGTIDTHSIHFLDGASGMDMATKQDLDLGCFEDFPYLLSVRW